MTDGPAPASAEPPPARSPWADVLLTPMRGGAVLGLVLLGAIAFGLSWLEGGVGDESGRMAGRLGLSMLWLLVFAVYARRIALATYQDRAVPWFGDERDSATFARTLSTFSLVTVLAVLPAFLVMWAAGAAGAPAWLTLVLGLAGVAVGAVHLPLGIASSVIREEGFAAGYATTFRAWKANRDAAKIAVVPTLAFLALLFAASLLAKWLVPAYEDDVRPEHDHDAKRDAARVLVFAVRFAAMWAALCSFRVAGLLARDVPEVREVLS